jgi:hypothetical protein
MLEKIKDLFKSKKTKEAEKYIVPSEPVDPKTIATNLKEPWVAVLDTHVNPTNPKNGFFELDWNEYFIIMLRENGYTGVNDEEIVDQWFGDLCKEIGSEENVPGMDRRGAGYINVNKLPNGRSEIS